MLKNFSFRGFRSVTPDQELCPWTPLGAQPSAQNTNTASRFCALHNGRTNPTLLRACNMSAGSTVCQWICRSVEIELLCTRHQRQKRLFLRRLMTAGYSAGICIPALDRGLVCRLTRTSPFHSGWPPVEISPRLRQCR